MQLLLSSLSWAASAEQYWLQVLIGPGAIRPNSKTYHESSSNLASSWDFLGLGCQGWWWWWMALLLFSCSVEGAAGWQAIFETLGKVVVPFYTAFVLIYLTQSMGSGPLQYLHRFLNTYYSKKRVAETTVVPTEEKREQVEQVESDEPQEQQQQPFDLSGSYKLLENDGFEEFLAIQGVPWALRRAANQARPIHRITHCGNTVTIQIKGIIESQTTYRINGPPVETNIRGRIFQDVVTYLDNHEKETNSDIPRMGLLVSKTALTEDYDVTVQRVWSPDQQRITMTSRAVFRDGRDPVECIQLFERIPEA